MQKKTRKQYTSEFKAKLVKEMLKEEKYLRFYNEQHIHQALDYQTPAEVYFARRLDHRTPLQGEG